MPDIKILNILDINNNTRGTKETDRAACCSTNTAIIQDVGCEQHCTVETQDKKLTSRKGAIQTQAVIKFELY